MSKKKILFAINANNNPYDTADQLEFKIEIDEDTQELSMTLDNQEVTAEQLASLQEVAEIPADVMELLQEGQVSSTNVEANPQEAATGSLTKIKINDDVYSISGGGGGGGDFTPVTNSDLPINNEDIVGEFYGINDNDGVYIAAPYSVKTYVNEDDNGIQLIEIVAVNESDETVAVISDDAEIGQMLGIFKVGQWVDWTKTTQPDQNVDVSVTKNIVGKIISIKESDEGTEVCVERDATSTIGNMYDRAIFWLECHITDTEDPSEDPVESWTINSWFTYKKIGCFVDYNGDNSEFSISSIFNKDYEYYWETHRDQLEWLTNLNDWVDNYLYDDNVEFYVNSSRAEVKYPNNGSCYIETEYEIVYPYYSADATGIWLLPKYNDKVVVWYNDNNNVLYDDNTGEEYDITAKFEVLTDIFGIKSNLQICDNDVFYDIVNVELGHGDQDENTCILYCNSGVLIPGSIQSGLKITVTQIPDDITPIPEWEIEYSAQFYDNPLYPGMEGGSGSEETQWITLPVYTIGTISSNGYDHHYPDQHICDFVIPVNNTTREFNYFYELIDYDYDNGNFDYMFEYDNNDMVYLKEEYVAQITGENPEEYITWHLAYIPNEANTQIQPCITLNAVQNVLVLYKYDSTPHE